TSRSRGLRRSGLSSRSLRRVGEALARAAEDAVELGAGEGVLARRWEQHLREIRTAADDAHAVVHDLVLADLEADPPRPAAVAGARDPLLLVDGGRELAVGALL